MFVSVSCISLNAREVFLLLFFWCYYIEKTWFFIPLALKFTKKYMNLHKWTFASEFFVFLLLFFCITFQSENYQIESAFVPIPGSKSFLKVDEHVAFVCKHALPSYCKDFTQIQVLQTKWPTKYAAQLKFTCSKSTTESFKKKVRNMFKGNCKDNRTTSLTSYWCLYCQLWTYFTSFSSAFSAEFEQVNVS